MVWERLCGTQCGTQCGTEVAGKSSRKGAVQQLPCAEGVMLEDGQCWTVALLAYRRWAKYKGGDLL